MYIILYMYKIFLRIRCKHRGSFIKIILIVGISPFLLRFYYILRLELEWSGEQSDQIKNKILSKIGANKISKCSTRPKVYRFGLRDKQKETKKKKKNKEKKKKKKKKEKKKNKEKKKKKE